MLNRLCEIYDNYLLKEGLPSMSADELIMEDFITLDQFNYLAHFSSVWEKAEDREQSKA